MNICTVWYSLTILLSLAHESEQAKRGGKGKGKGKGKLVLPYKNVLDYSKLVRKEEHPLGARIMSASHFSQIYKLGYKLLLICVADGTPVPEIMWIKDDQQLPSRKNTHISEEIVPGNLTRLGRIRSKLEIDPAAVGDQGTFTCMANNVYSGMAKNFKVEYTY